jgi:hypothetical protein
LDCCQKEDVEEMGAFEENEVLLRDKLIDFANGLQMGSDVSELEIHTAELGGRPEIHGQPLRPNYRSTVSVFTCDDADELLSRAYHPPGPWKIVALDGSTGRLIGFDKVEYCSSNAYVTQSVQGVERLHEDEIKGSLRLWFPGTTPGVSSNGSASTNK